MYITIKNNKAKSYKLKLNNKPIFLLTELQEIYQNSPIIANIDMEISDYKLYGCRVTALHRSINLLLHKHIGRELSIIETDKILDAGGEMNDAWIDNLNNPIYDIVDAPELINRINNRFNVNFEYKKIDISNKFLKEVIKNIIKKNSSPVIKMKAIYGKGSHFINIDGFVEQDKIIYLRIKETYQNYNGYDKLWVKWDIPQYYEIITDKENN